MDALRLVEFNEFWRRVVRMQLGLVDCGHNLGIWVGKELLEVLLVEVRDTNVADFAGAHELLHLAPADDVSAVRCKTNCSLILTMYR